MGTFSPLRVLPVGPPELDVVRPLLDGGAEVVEVLGQRGGAHRGVLQEGKGGVTVQKLSDK